MGLSSFLLVLILLLLLCMVVMSGSLHTCDWNQPLNLALYRAPKSKYNDQLVNHWVSKPWREDGKRIPCRMEVFDVKQPKDQRHIVIYSHGQSENLLTCYHTVEQMSKSLKMDVLAWDYSGYGLNDSDHWERAAEGINFTLRTIVDDLVSHHGYAYSNIIFWGYSLGTGPTTEVVAQLCENDTTKPRAMVLLAPYSGILDVVKDHTFDTLAHLFTERWNNQKRIARVTCPILLLHGISDGMIPPIHSTRLREANPKAQLYLIPNTGHTNHHYSELIKQVQLFLQSSN